MKKRFQIIHILLIILSLGFTTSVYATNGMNMIGFGARMSAMGGVSMGMSGDVNQMFTNPASIGFFEGQAVTGGIGLLLPGVHFTNSLNDIDGDNQVFPLPALGYVNGFDDSPFAFGVGFYAQGGMGATYPDVNHSIFRNYQDGQQVHAYIPQEYHSQIAYMKFVPTVAYRFNDQLSAGLGLQIGYATLEMAMPYSMNPLLMQGDTGMGMTFGQMFAAPTSSGGLGYSEVTAYADMSDGASAVGFGAQLGLQYRLNEKVTFGFGYTMQSDLTFEGDAAMDMTSQFGDAYEKMVMGAMMNDPGLTQQQAMDMVNTQLGMMGINPALGMEDSYDAEIEFSWPQQLAFGVALNPSEKLTIGLDISWINWSATMDKFEMSFTGGSNSNINTMMGTPNGDLNLEMPLDWDDQVVIGIGAEYWATGKLALRGGFNYASNPVPEETLIPIFPAVVESHITLGAGYAVTRSLCLSIGYELVLANEVDVASSIIADEYNGSSSELSENVIHYTITYRF